VPNPAILYRMTNRGFIREGYFADLTLVDLNSQWTVAKENLLYKCLVTIGGHHFYTKVTDFVNGKLFMITENSMKRPWYGNRLYIKSLNVSYFKRHCISNQILIKVHLIAIPLDTVY
jgi:hypothetical protein